jgi:hypothetical protein
MKAVDLKRDTIHQLLKKLPLVCRNLYSSFVSLPKLKSVQLIQDENVFELPNEFEIESMDELISFFKSLSDASSFLQIKDLIYTMVRFSNKRPETGSLDIMITFLVHTYMDYAYFIQSNSKDIDHIKLVFNNSNADDLETYKPLLNSTTIELIASWQAHGIILSDYFGEKQTFPEPDFLHLQNLFLQLKSFQPVKEPPAFPSFQPVKEITTFPSCVASPSQIAQAALQVQAAQQSQQQAQPSQQQAQPSQQQAQPSQQQAQPSQQPSQQPAQPTFQSTTNLGSVTTKPSFFSSFSSSKTSPFSSQPFQSSIALKVPETNTSIFKKQMSTFQTTQSSSPKEEKDESESAFDFYS